MKHYNKLLLSLVIGGLSVSCADEFKSEFTVDKPESIAQYEYLNAYGALKSYVNRTTDPNFKLGSGITVSDFLKKELVYSLAVANYDELTAGNAMKYASCVDDNGGMNFLQVSKFVEAAKAAGVGIYGHTLLWHAQQNNTYLNGLIAPTIIPGEVGSGGYCMNLTNESAQANIWNAQTWYTLSSPLTKGTEYTFTCMIKATDSYNPEIFLQSSIVSNLQEYPGGFAVGTEWTAVSLKFTPANEQINKITFNFGTFAGTINVDNVKLVATGSDENLIANGDFEEGNINGWTGWTAGLYENISEDGDGYSTSQSNEEGYCMNLTNESAQSNIWNAQTWYTLSSPLTKGTEYAFTCMIKATSSYSPEIYLQSSIVSGLQEYPGGFAVGTEWTEVKLKFTPSNEQINKMTFNFGTFAGTISVDNVKLVATGSDGNLIANGDFEEGNINGWTGWTAGLYEKISDAGKGYGASGGDQIIEKTDEEKKEILTGALETWIAGIMEACDGYVKAWDVVNEPMSDSHSTQLKSDPGKTDTNNFYWQDYLGKDYARAAVKFARQYGGDDLLLFVNDYNLEATYNNNAKCEGLIQMVAYWESDGVTKIDGIGTQMHVSYSMDPDKQQKKEACIVKMYELLAASGKLIKVTELDMGIVDASDNSILTANTTAEQHQLMADFYTFIVSKYFEIIPPAQRYGIAHWSPTDSPTNSGWRKGEPIGLWDLNYNRKPAYAGFADGINK